MSVRVAPGVEPTEAQLRAAEELAAGDPTATVWGHDAPAVRVQVGKLHWKVETDGEARRV